MRLCAPSIRAPQPGIVVARRARQSRTPGKADSVALHVEKGDRSHAGLSSWCDKAIAFSIQIELTLVVIVFRNSSTS